MAGILDGDEFSLMSAEEITLHGHRVSYRREGWGPPILLIHGVTGSSETWDEVIPFLSDRFTVIAPDLLGHGDSAKPRGDYSLGAYASGIRDLMRAIGHDRAARFYAKHGWRRAGSVFIEAEIKSGTFPLEVWRYENHLEPRSFAKQLRPV